MWDFQVGKRFSGSIASIGSGVPPKSSKVELHMLFQDPDMGHCLAAEGAQFHLQVLQFFSKKGIEEAMRAS